LSKGGFRSLAGRHPGGRPRGSRDKAKRMPKRTAPSPAQLAEARDRARDFLTQHEAALIDELMNCDDLRLKLELWKLLKSYGDGPPLQRIEVSTRKSPEQILEELAMRRMAIDSEVLAEPAQLAEAPSPSRAPVPAQIAPSEPPEPPAPTAESSSQRSPVVAPPGEPPRPSAFDEWRASDEGRRASPQLIEANRAILERPTLAERIANSPFPTLTEDDW
jgi:hypothetical protein